MHFLLKLEQKEISNASFYSKNRIRISAAKTSLGVKTKQGKSLRRLTYNKKEDIYGYIDAVTIP